jgi:2-hydroxychromene-2-carboxylate isomerase
VSDGRGELAQYGETGQVQKLALQFRHALLEALLARRIAEGDDVEHRAVPGELGLDEIGREDLAALLARLEVTLARSTVPVILAERQLIGRYRHEIFDPAARRTDGDRIGRRP